MKKFEKLAALAAVAGALLPIAEAGAASVQTVYSFQGQSDAALPSAALLNRNGVLYGTAQLGGVRQNGAGQGGGAVFRFDIATAEESVLHGFPTQSQRDGVLPASGLIDYRGRLYGVTQTGGGSGQDGIVYAIDAGTGQERILHRFGGAAQGDGASPLGNLLEHDGLLYGTTRSGGNSNRGTIFSLDPASGSLTILYEFTGQADGSSPMGGLVFLNGQFYGTTSHGGASGYGVVFSMDAVSHSLKVLHAFAGSPDGDFPGDLVLVNGVFYGTTAKGGNASAGTIFSVDPLTGIETTIYDFSGGTSGSLPGYPPLTVQGGRLYGTTITGGASNQGTVFSLDLQTMGFELRYSFTGGADGGGPEGLVVVNGALYGAAYEGGTYNQGVLYKLMP